MAAERGRGGLRIGPFVLGGLDGSGIHFSLRRERRRVSPLLPDPSILRVAPPALLHYSVEMQEGGKHRGMSNFINFAYAVGFDPLVQTRMITEVNTPMPYSAKFMHPKPDFDSLMKSRVKAFQLFQELEREYPDIYNYFVTAIVVRYMQRINVNAFSPDFQPTLTQYQRQITELNLDMEQVEETSLRAQAFLFDRTKAKIIKYNDSHPEKPIDTLVAQTPM